MSKDPIIDTHTPYLDPLQIRYQRVKAEIRKLRSELIELKDQMQEGLCDTCGIKFRRIRPTKRYCSHRCMMAAHHARQRGYDIHRIRRQMPAIEASGLMGVSAIAQVKTALDGCKANEIAEALALSPQRISQVLHKADKLAAAFEAVENASRLMEEQPA